MSFFQDMLTTISDRGRALIERPSRWGATPVRDVDKPASPSQMAEVCRALLSSRGEASGAALARRVLDLYDLLPKAAKIEFFHLLTTDFGHDQEELRRSWSAYEATPRIEALRALIEASEAPRQELFRRLNLAPSGTSRLVAMRRDILQAMDSHKELAVIDDDLVHLFRSWFNRGFLVLRHISWSTPADVLERIIRYEAVHEINGWGDLQRRLAPPDRRCYAFFHPSLIDDPLIFVEVALMREAPHSVSEILAEERAPLKASEATTAVFYSISNCQDGLRGISFGNFLIKQVVEELSRDLPNLTNFITLSPAPSFGRWLRQIVENPPPGGLGEAQAVAIAALNRIDWTGKPEDVAKAVAMARPIMLGLASEYYLKAKNSAGKPVDPVARFHLGNGARLDRLNWPSDTSQKGLKDGAGLMVNYLYDLQSIEANHEAFANSDTIAASPAVLRQHREFEAARKMEMRNV